MPPSTSEARTRRFNFQRAYQPFSKAGNNLKQSFTADLFHYTSNQAAKSAIGGAIGIEAAKTARPRRSTCATVMGISANDLCQHDTPDPGPVLPQPRRRSAAAGARLPIGAGERPSTTAVATACTGSPANATSSSGTSTWRWTRSAPAGVRGLASQHAFLAAPHLELTVNLRYSTAIAWSLVEAARLPLPDQHDHLAPGSRVAPGIPAARSPASSSTPGNVASAASARSPDGEWKKSASETDQPVRKFFYIQTRTVALPSLHWHRSQPLCSAPCGTSEHWRRSGNLGSLRAVIHRELLQQ